MNINILDCTLRDGGYINDFSFGRKSISEIIGKLSRSGIEIVECGFLKSGANDPDRSLFGSVGAIEKHIPENKEKCMYVAMIAFGDISIDEIEPYDGSSVSGIRLTFHEHDIDSAFDFASQLSDKGYKVFIQPVGTASYTDKALLDLIEKVNRMEPFAFYLVDTLGTMYKNNLLRMFYLVDNNLNKGIRVGFHSHNNLQLSFSNAQELIELNSKRDIIIDSSVFGMGRGAGNLCTELLTQYINENICEKYDIIPILEIMDEYILPIYSVKTWGYSAPYYLAAVNGCHPNYASYLMNKQSLCIRDISAIIKRIPQDKKHLYNKELINTLYLEYQERSIDDSTALAEISGLCRGRKVLILAPGRTLLTHKEQIKKYISENDPVVFSINHIPSDYRCDRVFVSNLKRFKGIDDAVSAMNGRVIITSNIAADPSICTVNYSAYLNDSDVISDNSGLMLLNILKKAGVSEAALAGYDGFDITAEKNYFDEKLMSAQDADRRILMNKAMTEYLSKMNDSLKLTFITPSVYDRSRGGYDEQV